MEKAAGAGWKILPQAPSLPRNTILERASFLNQTPQPSKILPILQRDNELFSTEIRSQHFETILQNKNVCSVEFTL